MSSNIKLSSSGSQLCNAINHGEMCLTAKPCVVKKEALLILLLSVHTTKTSPHLQFKMVVLLSWIYWLYFCTVR